MNSVAFHTEKDLKPKKRGGIKKVYILAKDVNTEFEIKAKKCQPEKGLLFGAPKFRQL